MKTVIRTSMLPSYADCPRRAAAKQYRKEIIDAGYDLQDTQPSVGAAVGTAVHSAIADMLMAKKEGLQSNLTSDIYDRAMNGFRDEIETGAVWDNTTPNHDAAEKQIMRLTKTYQTYMLPQVDPLLIEQELRADAGDDFEITGHVDLVTTDGLVRDHKTGALQRPYQAQLGGYSLLVRSQNTGFVPHIRGIAKDFLQRVSLKKAQPEPQTTFYDVEISEYAAWSCIDHIKRDVTEFRRRVNDGDKPPEDAFLPNNMSLMCSKKYCPAWGTNFCKLGRKDHE